jgi:predicted DNA binding CopG/RHH family protein
MKKEKENKTAIIRIRITEKQMNELKTKAIAKGMTVGQYVKRHFIAY